MINCYSNEKEIGFKPFKYPAGEVGYKINEIPSKIICWYENSDDFVLMAMLMDQFPEAELFFPYLPFGREDRRVNNKASYGLKTFLKIFDKGKWTTFDAHSVYGNGTNIRPHKIVDEIAEDLQPDTYVFPDKGAADRYSNFTIGEEVVYGEKQRDLDTGNVISYTLNQAPQGKKIFVIDDICDGGKTFIELAKLLLGRELYLYVSHGIFSKGFDELKRYYKHIYTTDSYKGERDNEFVTEYRCL